MIKEAIASSPGCSQASADCTTPRPTSSVHGTAMACYAAQRAELSWILACRLVVPKCGSIYPVSILP
eukprot:3521640-Pleurochrysis_carterae.AAC.1